MSNSVASVTAEIGALITLDKAAGWDPVGLQIGDPAAPVRRLAVCHEVTPHVVEQVVAADVDMVIAYHPLLFHATKRIVAGSGPAGRAFELIAAGVALAVVHTAFDVAPGGTADALAAALDVENVTGFGPAWGVDSVKVVTFVPADAADDVARAMAAAGAGRIGAYSACSYRSQGVGTFVPAGGADPHVGVVGQFNEEPEVRLEMIAPNPMSNAVVAALVGAHPYEEPAYDVIATRSNAGFIGRRGELASPMTVAELTESVSERLGGVVRSAGSGLVRTVGVVPGSGGSLLTDTDVDVVVTGDVSHHQARAALESGTAVIDPGHAATERPGVKALYAAVAEVLDAIDLTETDQDPWKGR